MLIKYFSKRSHRIVLQVIRLEFHQSERVQIFIGLKFIENLGSTFFVIYTVIITKRNKKINNINK